MIFHPDFGLNCQASLVSAIVGSWTAAAVAAFAARSSTARSFRSSALALTSWRRSNECEIDLKGLVE